MFAILSGILSISIFLIGQAAGETTYYVTNEIELNSTLLIVQPGDTVQLADNTKFNGPFYVANISGNSTHPITISGGYNTIIACPPEYAESDDALSLLDLTDWNIVGINFASCYNHINLIRTNFTKVENCTFDIYQRGIIIHHTLYTTIQHSVFLFNDRGILGIYSYEGNSLARIKDNEFITYKSIREQHYLVGIDIGLDYNTVITNNKFFGKNSTHYFSHWVNSYGKIDEIYGNWGNQTLENGYQFEHDSSAILKENHCVLSYPDSYCINVKNLEGSYYIYSDNVVEGGKGLSNYPVIP